MAIVVIALLVTSCQRDEFVTLGEAEQADPSYKPAVIFKQLELSEIEDLVVLNRLQLSKNRAFSTGMAEGGGYRLIKGTNFSIKSTGIVFMESQKAITYTFGVNDAENPTRIVNLLVVKTKLTDEYKSYLVDYALTEQDVIHIKSGQLNLFDVREKTTITPFRSGQISFVSGNGAPCYTTVAHIGVERCSDSGNHLPGDPDCVPKDGYYYVYMTTELAPCGGGGGGGSGGGSGAGGGIGGGAGGPAGGGSSGNDSTPGTIERPGEPSQDQDPTDPKDDSPVFGGGDAATTPVLKDKDPEFVEDCKTLHRLSASADMTPKLEALIKAVDRFNTGYEEGFYALASGGYTFGYKSFVSDLNNNQSSSIEANHVGFRPNPTMFVQAHNHTGNLYQMFSADDLYSFYSMAHQFLNAMSGVELPDYISPTCFLVVNGNTYALRLNDMDKFSKLEQMHGDKQKWKDFNALLVNGYHSIKGDQVNVSQDKLANTFLNFIKDFGISVYQSNNEAIEYAPSKPLNEQNSDWVKIEYNKNGSEPLTNSCND